MKAHIEACKWIVDEPKATRTVVLGTAIVADLPLCLVADTVLLPWTVNGRGR